MSNLSIDYETIGHFLDFSLCLTILLIGES